MNQLNNQIEGIGSWLLFRALDDLKSLGAIQNSIYKLEKENCFFQSWRQANKEIEYLY